ncbi:MAG: hypothetical protein F6K42_22870, partial [Leptolyngbya sp. SIO1D8]|nr:hypothetical protein [Leptolyngbya sp. SIO1D8]
MQFVQQLLSDAETANRDLQSTLEELHRTQAQMIQSENSRHGFAPAHRFGFQAPYSILDANIDAWMVQALRPNVMGAVSGKVICADTLNKPEYWQE